MTSAQDADLQPQSTTSVNGLALAAMVLGIVAVPVALVPLFGWVLAFMPAVLAIVFGHIGYATANRIGSGKRAAITGCVTGYIALALPVFYLVASGIVGIVQKG